MLFKKPTSVANLDAPNTIIGKGVVIDAERMSGKESVRIDGTFNGSIEIKGSLVLGDSGKINGDVVAEYFLVAGEVIGNILCSSQLHFASTAKVTGDVQASSIIIDEGGQVMGRYIIGKNKLDADAVNNKVELIGDKNGSKK